MQYLFLFLFGGVVSFILYLSYDKHVSDKKKVDDKDELKIDLNKYSDLIETSEDVKTETNEKVQEQIQDVEENDVVVEKFKARRNNK